MVVTSNSVIASKAKQSSPTIATGLPRFVRNDGVVNGNDD